MKKILPKVFANSIDKKLTNQDRLYYGKESVRSSNDSIPIPIKINKIFASPNYIYKKEVVITTSSTTLNKTIIGKTGKYLLTSDNSKILIDDIIDIYEK